MSLSSEPFILLYGLYGRGIPCTQHLQGTCHQGETEAKINYMTCPETELNWTQTELKFPKSQPDNYWSHLSLK